MMVDRHTVMELRLSWYGSAQLVWEQNFLSIIILWLWDKKMCVGTYFLSWSNLWLYVPDWNAEIFLLPGWAPAEGLEWLRNWHSLERIRIEILSLCWHLDIYSIVQSMTANQLSHGSLRNMIMMLGNRIILWWEVDVLNGKWNPAAIPNATAL